MPKKKKGAGKSKSPKKKGGDGKKKKKKKKGKKKKVHKIDLENFDPVPFCDPRTGELPLPLSLVEKIAVGIGTSLELVYQKVIDDPEVFSTFFRIDDVLQKMNANDGASSLLGKEEIVDEKGQSFRGVFDLTELGVSEGIANEKMSFDASIKKLESLFGYKGSGLAFEENGYESSDSERSFSDEDFGDKVSESPGSSLAKLYLSCCENSQTQVVSKVLYALREDRDTIELTYGSLRSKGAICLFQVLDHGRSDVQSVIVRDNNIDSEAAPSIAAFVQNSMSLLSIDVGSNQLGFYKRSLVGALTPLAEALGHSNRLEKLCLAKNGLADDFIVKFSAALIVSQNKCIKSIDLSHNKISWKGAAAFAEFLERQNSLNTLNLAWNNLCSKGGLVLAEALLVDTTSTPGLTVLNLDWNGLDNKVVISLAAWIKENNVLQQLTLSNNNISATGSKALADALMNNFALEYLDISYNGLKEKGVTSLLECLRVNVGIKVLRCIRACDMSTKRDKTTPAARLVALRREVLSAREMFTDVTLDLPVAEDGIVFQQYASDDEDSGEDEDVNADGAEVYRSIWQDRCRDSDAATFWDNDDVLRRAYESDWELSGIPSLIYEIDELEICHEIFSRYYGTIWDLFRYYAATLGANRKLMLFKKLSWQKFSQEMRIIDDDQLKPNDLATLFRRCGGIPVTDEGGDDSGDEPNSIEGLMRYEFLELIVRTALKKYHFPSKSRKNPAPLLTPSYALRKFMDVDILPYAFHTDHVGHFPGPSFFRGSDNFRDNRLYFVEINDLLWAHKIELKKVFDHFARGDGSFTFDASHRMSLREWVHFCMNTELINDTFTRTDVAIPFAYSILCVVNELKSPRGEQIEDRTTLRSEIGFTDFLESLGRVSELMYAKTVADTKLKLSKKLSMLIDHILKVHENLFEENEECAEEDHFALEKEIEEANYREEMDRLSLTSTPPDKDKYEVEGAARKVTVKATLDDTTVRRITLSQIAKLCIAKVKANRVGGEREPFPTFLKHHFLVEHGAGIYKTKMKEFFTSVVASADQDIIISWFVGMAGTKSKYDSDMVPSTALMHRVMNYNASLEEAFLGVIEEFLPLQHLVKRFENGGTMCSMVNIKNALDRFLDEKKDRDNCMKIFKSLATAAKQVSFPETLKVILEHWCLQKSAKGKGKK